MHSWSGIEVITPLEELSHPMWHRMWTRAGFDAERIPVTPLEQIVTLKPDTHTVILLGETALQLHGDGRDLFRYRGRRYYRYHWGRPVVVCPTMLPSSLLPRKGQETGGSKLLNRPARFQGAWIHDVQKFVRFAGSVVIPATTYLEDPSPARFHDWAERCLTSGDPYLSFDIETQYKLTVQDEEDFEEDELPIGAMLRISFAHTVNEAVSVPWNSEYFGTIRRLLESEMSKVTWNGAQFDVPRLREEGFPVGGKVYDYQDGWHLLQSDQPKGLEYVSSFYSHTQPWKHLNGSAPATYSCIDADVALQNALGIEKDLTHFGQFELFERHVVELMPILDEAGRRGNLVDTAFSSALRAELEVLKRELHEKAQGVVPQHLKPTKRYKKLPKETEGRTFVPVLEWADKVSKCTACGVLHVKKSDHFKGGKKNPCKAAGGEIRYVEAVVTEYDEVLPFNMASSAQIKAYAAHFKHPLGKDRKTDAVSANAQAVEKLRLKYGQQHPLYELLGDYAKIGKTLSTYIYTPDAQGLIHTTYVNAPSTWRLASRRVNLQNVGKRESNKWAKKARRQIVARPGHVFVQADSTSIEAVVTGRLIHDDNFIAVAKKSIHAYLCCQELKIPFTDENIELVKKQHKGLYNQFKTAVYLLLYGGDPYLMFMTNPDVFPSKDAAQVIQDKIYSIMPNLKIWQEQTREMAKREGVLTSPWGYRHYFYDVYTFKRNKQDELLYDEFGHPQLKPGQDAKRALAFRPQNSAGAFCRDSLLLIGQSPWRQYMTPIVTVHDGYTLEVPEHLATEAKDFLIDVLTRPVPELGNIRIGCEVDMGKNWADWSEDNPAGMKTLIKVEV
jgi:DNA polymerase I-like protein with 3'-5' exonuclease and polymerase domains